MWLNECSARTLLTHSMGMKGTPVCLGEGEAAHELVGLVENPHLLLHHSQLQMHLRC